MKAVVCSEYGPLEQLQVQSIPEPQMRSGCVRIGVKVAAINPPDVTMPQGKYHVKPSTPFVLGIEAAGVVMEVAPDITSLRIGDRVMTYAGDSCFAEQIVVPATRVFKVPDAMDYETAAGFTVVYGTAHHALAEAAALQRGETLVVLGASGGIGLCSIQIGKVLGARVIAVASTPQRLAKCKEHGADELIQGDESLRDRIKDLTGGRGAEVIMDIVGGDATDSAIRAIAPYGRYLIAGYASGIVPSIKANLIFLKQARVIGASFRVLLERDPKAAGANIEHLCDLWRRGLLRPEVTARYPIEQVVDALKHVGERKVIGKTVLQVQPA
jgi:NADPH2:quinone reductase